MTPIAGLSVTMHDGHDQNEVGLNGIKDGVRKNSREASSNVFLQNSPSLRRLANQANGVLDHGHEAEFQTFLTLPIIVSRSW